MQKKSSNQESGKVFPPNTQSPSQQSTQAFKAAGVVPRRPVLPGEGVEIGSEHFAGLPPSQRRSVSFSGTQSSYQAPESAHLGSSQATWNRNDASNQNRPLRRSLPSYQSGRGNPERTSEVGGSLLQQQSRSPNQPFRDPPKSVEQRTLPEKKHVSTVTITPMPPHLYSPGPGQSSTPGRHLTSVNLQLRPPTSEQPLTEITTVPVSPSREGSPSSTEFNSQVHISFSPTGTSVTAMRTAPRHSPSPRHPTNLPQGQKQAHKPADSPLNANIYGARSGANASARFPSRTPTGSTATNFGESGYSPGNVHVTSRGNGRKSPSENLGNELSYIDALLQYQRQKYFQLEEEVQTRREQLMQLRLEVNRLEETLTRIDTVPFLAEEMHKIRDEIRRLRIEVFLLTREVDLSAEKEVPLGVTDEDFYKNIYTGAIGPMTSERKLSTSGSSGSEMQEGAQYRSNESQRRLSEVDENNEDNRWQCSQCTFLNHPALHKCEVCEMPRLIVGDDVRVRAARVEPAV